MKTRPSSQPAVLPANPPDRGLPAAGRLVGLAPVYGPDARLLLLGSFPGAASLQAAQYYAHPRNAFWPILAELTGERGLATQPYEARLACLRRHGVALWDAVAACRREGSLDSAIESPEPSDLPGLVARLPGLRAIGCNGALAYRQALAALPQPSVPLLRLPSTSPAHAGLRLPEKVDAWRSVLGRYL